MAGNGKKPAALAGVLSLLIPGAGQIYSGACGQGLFWMALAAIAWLNAGGLTGVLCHIAAAVAAWFYARQSDKKQGLGCIGSLIGIEENFDILKKKKR